MLIGTKGRYALRLMVFIAASGENGRVALRRVADAEGISLKYLEQLAHLLVKAGLLESSRGQGGGYLLTRDASDIKVGDVLRAVEGTTAPVDCNGLSGGCSREDVCSTVQFWNGLNSVIEEYVDGVTLADLASTSHVALIP